MRRYIGNKAELTPLGRQLMGLLTILYALAVAMMCFSPQPIHLDDIETPNLLSYGRLRFLLLPFNSFLAFDQLTGVREIVWVIGQNVLNIFLLFPLLVGLLTLYPPFRTWQRATLLAFVLSLGIETTQLVVDLLYDANRVFEIDDLWTNSLGGWLAFWSYHHASNYLAKHLS